MKDYSAKSGERYNTKDTNLIGGDHLWRYRYVASRLNSGDARLFGADVFCGSGYGSSLVATATHASILAIDGSAESIELASGMYQDPAIIWACKLFPFDLPDACFDFVMSMESIEHVKDFETFFWVLVKSIKPGGQLFISVPNETVMPYTDYKWHYRHFVPSEVRALATKYGLREVFAASTRCQLLKNGKATVFYPYQMTNDKPLALDEGDTMFFEFSKDAP